MTNEILDAILDEIKKSGAVGATSRHLAEQFGYSMKGIWKPLKELEQLGEIKIKKIKGLFRIFSVSKSDSSKEFSMTNNEVGSELQTFLIDTIAKFSAGKVLETVMPLVRQKCVEEFGMTPIVHEVKVGSASPVRVDGCLPPCFDSILAYAANGNPVMMTGPAGTGKGFIARNVAKSCNAEFFEVNAVKNSYDLTGFVDANSRFVRTPFYDACKSVSEGKAAVFLFDEMDCSEPEVLKVFNEALSSKEFTFPNDEHLAFDDLIVLCACNTFGTGSDDMYCGVQLDASTLDRFVMVKVDYNRNVEMRIAQYDEELVDFIDLFRLQTEKNGLPFIVSYRSLKRIVSMRGLLPLKQIMKECLVKSMADDDLKNILNNMTIDDNNLYYRACKGENVEYAKKNVQGELFPAA